eukprot:7383533-Prymnesium_polylepis.3
MFAQLLVGGCGAQSAPCSSRLASTREQRAQVPAAPDCASRLDWLSRSASCVPAIQAACANHSLLCTNHSGELALPSHMRKFDQTMAAGCQIVFVCAFLGGMVVLQFEELDTHAATPPGFASEMLGIRSSEEAVVMMICVAFVMLVLLALT